ncbi:uncharacterized protein LTR77_001235 [Saxophila tyrrhenica]|uniref:Uncharacterized protein n=1 Tax=Saxophila tyrrhenica TaxID=1690608 RepID=A0AAV9PKH8_9PEZI|nr:hypothetical protein LTR77_001235 [Saxophila tyrrhenica]
MHLPPPPNSRDLLPPLLACLPTAFVSPRPPPALLPLLSPLLRQRVNFLAGNAPRSDGWLPLLSWDAERAEKLPPVIERMQLEPHPVSGEVELDDTRPAKYRRLDEETLQSRIEVEQFELLPIFVWCETDEHGGTGAGWKLSELQSLEDLDDDTEWFDTILEATDAASARAAPQVRQDSGQNQQEPSQPKDAEEDDDYWASYDRTPSRTPAPQQAAAPAAPPTAQAAAGRQRTQSELDYYARYGAEVQPAMDAYDPDEEHPELGESSLNGSALPHSQSQQTDGRTSRPNGTSLFPASSPPEQRVSAPEPISPISSSTSSIERLETKAAEMSELSSQRGSVSRGSDRAQMAVKQHISTDIKSLFRLAKSSGMERKEFERIVKTELDCLSMMEQDE